MVKNQDLAEANLQDEIEAHKEKDVYEPTYRTLFSYLPQHDVQIQISVTEFMNLKIDRIDWPSDLEHNKV